MLLKDTKIFIDLDILFDTDTFVCDTLYHYEKTINDKNDMLYPLKLSGDIVNPDAFKNFGQVKTYHNPLYDFMHMPEFDMADKLYDSVIYSDTNSLESYSKLKLTKLGDMFKVLLKDEKLTKAYIYSKKIPDALYDHIFGTFENTGKIGVITGSKTKFLSEVQCDEYFFANVNDVEEIIKVKKEEKVITIYCVEYKFNMDEENPEKLRVSIDPVDLKLKHNILLLSVKIPIV